MKIVLPSFATSSFSKKLSSFLILSLLMSSSFAGIIVTPTTTSVNISADKAANATSPEFTSLGAITLTEAKANDFAITMGGSKTFILTAPSGWIFNTKAGNISVNRAGDFKTVSMKVKPNTISIDFVITGTTHIDMISIAGIEVKAIDGAVLPCLGQIHIAASNAGTAKFPGLKASANKDGQGGTNFGMMSQTSGAATSLAFINKPDSSVVEVAFDQQPVIITKDQFGNATSNGLKAIQQVKIRLSSGTGSLEGTAILNIGTQGGNGMVNFSDLSINAAGAKKIMAISGSLTFAVTNEFTVYQEETTTEVSAEDYDPELICITNTLSNPNSLFI